MRQFGCKNPIFGIIDKFRNKKTPKVFLGRPTSFLKIICSRQEVWTKTLSCALLSGL